MTCQASASSYDAGRLVAFAALFRNVTATERPDSSGSMAIPVIDLFAGPGGLGEGFSSASGADFRVAVSIEKDAMAHETLRLRAAHRALQSTHGVTAADWDLWDRTINDQPWNVAFHGLRDATNERIAEACRKAEAEALALELGPASRATASRVIRERLKAESGRELPRNAVLIGGPPCQAYSIVGRSRNKGVQGYRPESDHRHFLYREYLHVIGEFEPAVFVMENVKGILTSTVDGRRMFETITRDLEHPAAASGNGRGAKYVLHALPATDSLIDDPLAQDFVVKAECHGIPQARHRVIVVGVRRDIAEAVGRLAHLRASESPTVRSVIADLPRLRPALSYRGSDAHWTDPFTSKLFRDTLHELSRTPRLREVTDVMLAARSRMLDQDADPGTGSDRRMRRSTYAGAPHALADWYQGTRPTRLIANHECRAHMPSDLVRYMFVSAFGAAMGESPKLGDFPECLLPEHSNVTPGEAAEAIFKDRFRVQIDCRHSTTVTSHIAKDGHAFIHYDPSQSRSLTVREAARLQTFPDSYVFLGNRTSQYTQVGNAVPPLLARQIAEVVAHIMKRADRG